MYYSDLLGQISVKNKTPIKVGHKRASDILFSVKAKVWIPSNVPLI